MSLYNGIFQALKKWNEASFCTIILNYQKAKHLFQLCQSLILGSSLNVRIKKTFNVLLNFNESLCDLELGKDSKFTPERISVYINDLDKTPTSEYIIYAECLMIYNMAIVQLLHAKFDDSLISVFAILKKMVILKSVNQAASRNTDIMVEDMPQLFSFGNNQSYGFQDIAENCIHMIERLLRNPIIEYPLNRIEKKIQFMLGVIILCKREYPLCEYYVNIMSSYCPKDFEISFLIGLNYYALGSTKRSIKILERLDSHADSIYMLALMLTNDGCFDQAIPLFLKCKELTTSRTTQVCNMLGICYIYINQYTIARHMLEKAPLDILALNNLAILHHKMYQYSDEIKILNKLIQILDGYPSYMTYISKIYIKWMLYKAYLAIDKKFDALLEIKYLIHAMKWKTEDMPSNVPDDIIIVRAYIFLLLELKHYDDCLQEIASLKNLINYDPVCSLYKADALTHMGKLLESYELLTQTYDFIDHFDLQIKSGVKLTDDHIQIGDKKILIEPSLYILFDEQKRSCLQRDVLNNMFMVAVMTNQCTTKISNIVNSSYKENVAPLMYNSTLFQIKKGNLEEAIHIWFRYRHIDPEMAISELMDIAKKNRQLSEISRKCNTPIYLQDNIPDWQALELDSHLIRIFVLLRLSSTNCK